jgi:hypothetical protein
MAYADQGETARSMHYTLILRKIKWNDPRLLAQTSITHELRVREPIATARQAAG